MACFLTAASRKEQVLNTFNVQMKFVTSLGSLMYANGVGVCKLVRGGLGDGGGWVAAGKAFWIYPLIPKRQKPCQEQEGTSKMPPLAKFAPPHPLSWHPVSSPRSNFKSKRFAARGKREKGRRRLELATDLCRAVGQIGGCWCNMSQWKRQRRIMTKPRVGL